MKPTRFILVDDDELTNTISRLLIKKALPTIEIVDFVWPEQGLHYIETAYNNDIPTPSILLLDINMPIMSGWDFLEKYGLLDKKIKDQITIYLLSSSVDDRDKGFAADNKYVKQYVVKPITLSTVEKIYEESDFSIALPG